MSDTKYSMLGTFFYIGFLVLALSVVYFYFELRNTKEKYKQSEKDNARKLLELRILNELSDKIGYSLSSKDIASAIANSAGKLFHVSAVSYAIIESDNIELMTIAQEDIGPHFISGVKDIMLHGIYTIDDQLRERPVTHHAKGIDNEHEKDLLLDGLMQHDMLPLSYFNIPLVLNNRFTGIINITSKNRNAYQEEDMNMLYKIVNKAQLAIGRLEKTIDVEKGKIDSLVKSLSTGEIFFTIERNKNGVISEKQALHLFTINSAAKRFLDLKVNNPDLMGVLSSFNLKPNIIGEMKDVIVQKKSTIYRDIEINELMFNIYLTPVFTSNFDRVIGVALTMQDVTREHEIQKIRERFTNMMIHELRAPLTAIKGAAELLMQPETAEEDQVKMRLIIKNSSARLLQNIDDMLDSAKIDAGKMMVEKVEANINEVLATTVQELSYAASTRAILIENHLDESIPHFFFDPIRIGQVVANLLSNAIKYSEPHTLIEIFSRIHDDHVEIEVKDHGFGIEADKKDLLFLPFSQVNFSKRMKGTGLGLYISKAIVEEHGGKIWLDSEEGKGTSAFISLPMVKEAEKPAYDQPQRMAN